jgi:hypothetical protein
MAGTTTRVFATAHDDDDNDDDDDDDDVGRSIRKTPSGRNFPPSPPLLPALPEQRGNTSVPPARITAIAELIPPTWYQGTVDAATRVPPSYEHGGRVLARDWTSSDRWESITPLPPPVPADGDVVPDVNRTRAPAPDSAPPPAGTGGGGADARAFGDASSPGRCGTAGASDHRPRGSPPVVVVGRRRPRRRSAASAGIGAQAAAERPRDRRDPFTSRAASAAARPYPGPWRIITTRRTPLAPPPSSSSSSSLSSSSSSSPWGRSARSTSAGVQRQWIIAGSSLGPVVVLVVIVVVLVAMIEEAFEGRARPAQAKTERRRSGELSERYPTTTSTSSTASCGPPPSSRRRRRRSVGDN